MNVEHWRANVNILVLSVMGECISFTPCCLRARYEGVIKCNNNKMLRNGQSSFRVIHTPKKGFSCWQSRKIKEKKNMDMI